MAYELRTGIDEWPELLSPGIWGCHMVAQRDSINRAAKALCELVFEGGEITSIHQGSARRLMKLVEAGGAYQKKYDTHEERVLNRHLSLYRNKRDAAKTDIERERWNGRIREQQAKLRAFRGDLDLDGL